MSEDREAARAAAIPRAIADCIDAGAAVPLHIDIGLDNAAVTLGRYASTRVELDREFASWLPHLTEIVDHGWRYHERRGSWFRLIQAELPTPAGGTYIAVTADIREVTP